MDKNKIIFYSDESCHIKNNDADKGMALVTIYGHNNVKKEFNKIVNRFLKENKISGEVKWGKISNGNLNIYKSLIDILKKFIDNNYLRVRTLLADVNKTEVTKNYNDWYHSMYYYLFRNVIYDFQNYENFHLYIDKKDTNSKKDVVNISEYLTRHFLWTKEIMASAVESSDHRLMQFADIIAGAMMYKHRNIVTSTAKLNLIAYIEKVLSVKLNENSPLKEKRFNTFVWHGNK